MNNSRSNTKVGFIGLGRMGQGMATNILQANTRLVVFDQRKEAADELQAKGAGVAADVRDLTNQADVIFTSLPGPKQLEEVVFGQGGIYENLRAGQVLFDLSTSSVSLARRISAAFGERGAFMLDAPVSGGPAGAASGDLVIWVGGDRAVFDTHLPVLRAFSDKPRHVGPIGSGTVTKLVHNLTGYMIMQGLAEGFSVGVKAGVDPLDLWEAMRLGVVGKASPLNMLVKQFLPGNYEPPAFALELALKDVNLATSLGRELGIPMRMANLTLAEMTEAVARGMGAGDSRSYLKLQLERAGVEIAVDPERLRKAVEDPKPGDEDGPN